MSSFEEGFARPWNPESDNCEWLPTLKPLYPKIAAALEGQVGWENDSQKRPPYTLMIGTRDGRLRFTLSNPEVDRMYACQITNASDVLGSIESALAHNEGEWFKRRDNRGGNGRKF